jgi:hypothetical protein
MTSRLTGYTLFVIILLLATLASDVVSKYLAVQGHEFSRASLIVRFIFEIGMLIYLFLHLKRKELVPLIFILILFVLVFAGQLIIGNSDKFFEHFVYFNKYVYMFILYIFFSKLLFLEESKKDLIFDMFKLIILVHIVSVFIGLFFEIDFLKTFYDKDYRFGYNGFIKAANESSIVIVLILSFLYFRVIFENGSKLLLFISIIFALLSGLKAVYAFIFLLGIYHALIEKSKLILAIIIIFFVYIFIYADDILNNESIQMFISYYFRTVEDQGWLYMLLSGRQEYLDLRLLELMEDWSFFNFLIGGQDITVYMVEMDFFDLFLFFGLLGSAIYLYLFYWLFVKKLLCERFFLFFFLSILSMAFFSGHFFTSSIGATFFVLVTIYFQNHIRKLQ